MIKKKLYPVLKIIGYVLLLLFIDSAFGTFWSVLTLILSILLIVFIFRYKIITNLGLLFLAKGNEKKAKELFSIIINKNIEFPKAYLYYANIFLHDGNHEEAKDLLLKSLNYNPDVLIYKNIKLSLSSCYWLSNDIDKAIETLEELRSEYEYINHSTLSTLGYMYFLKEDYDKAEEISLLAIKDNESSHSAWDNLGQIYFMEKKYDEAVEAFNKALSYKATLVDSLYYLGLIYDIKGDKNLALDYLEKASVAPITSLNTVTLEEINNKIISLNA